jgi:hypothetical protein
MARHNTAAPRPNAPQPKPTHEGGAGWKAGPLQELAFTAACSFLEDSFYEKAGARNKRIIGLVEKLAVTNPDGVVDLIRTLRQDFGVRSVSILIAAEYAHASLATGKPVRVREAVANACYRADEPAELLAYWLGKWGRSIPRAVKLGLGDAARWLYTQRAAMKWDSKDRAVRMADVLEMCHVKPLDDMQATLYRYMLDLRHRGKDAWDIDIIDDGEGGRMAAPGHYQYNPELLNLFQGRQALMAIPSANRRAYLRNNPGALGEAGLTWEALSSYLPGGMDAEAWRWAIPQMGVFALVRNLSNFDKANIGDAWVDRVIDKITNEEDVVASRIYPYNVALAYRNAPSDNWKRALNKTVDLAAKNAPSLPRSLVVVDCSMSMRQPLSTKSQAMRITVAALQAASVVRNSPGSTLSLFGTNHAVVDDWQHRSVLAVAHDIEDMCARNLFGSATYGHSAIADFFDPTRHDRVLLFTDDQMRDSGHVDISHVPQLVTFNCEGYESHATWGKDGAQANITVAGFSDQVFAAVAKLLG